MDCFETETSLQLDSNVVLAVIVRLASFGCCCISEIAFLAALKASRNVKLADVNDMHAMYLWIFTEAAKE